MPTGSPVSRENEYSPSRNESCYGLENRKHIKETSKKLKRDSRSAYDQADAFEENGNQKEDSICTHCIENSCDDVRGEISVQFVMCEDWCCEECAGAAKDTVIYNITLFNVCSFLCLKLL